MILKKGKTGIGILLVMLALSRPGIAQDKMPEPIEMKTTPQPIKVPEIKKTPASAIRLKPLDSVEAGLIAKALMDTTVLVGTFEAPDVKTFPRKLSSGVLPELENNYFDLVVGNLLVKMNTYRAFRGNFDSLIYVPMPSTNLDAEEAVQFYPYPGTRWLLLLKSPYSEDGSASENWARDLKKGNSEKFLNSKTVFAVRDEFHGSLILKWNNDYPTALNSYSIAPGAMEEMNQLMDMLESARKAKWHSEAPSALSSVKWKDESIRKLSVRLDQLLNLKAPKEQEEPVTPGQ